MWTGSIARRGLRKKEAHRDIGDRGFEEASVGDIGDWKTPKPNCYFLLRTEKRSGLRAVTSRTDLWVKS
jgi:hypothetical protein